MVKSFAVMVQWKSIRRFLYRGLLLLTAASVIMASMSSSSIPAAQKPAEKARSYTRSLEFDYVGWMLQALSTKFLELSLGTGGFLTADSRRELVLEYLALVDQMNHIEAQIRMIYADPTQGSPETKSAGLRRDLETLSRKRGYIEPVAEGILQEQVNTIVAELGLDIGGQAFPPVMYHVTPLPLALIISPRHVIRQDVDISLLPDLPLERQIELEERVARALDVSALVVNVGGVGVYPSMVMETGNIDRLSEVVAHEWVHHYLTTRPLGINYMKSPELRTINETAASIGGSEIGLEVLKRYYPEFIPPSPPPAPPAVENGSPVEPPVFDFYREMHTTRVKVDEMLEAGEIEAAEAYMEARRQIFWEQGYRGLRKLNQAYFAFHGAYADTPVGAAGEDPVGAAVRRLRQQSASLEDFLRRIAWVTEFTQLQEMADPAN